MLADGSVIRAIRRIDISAGRNVEIRFRNTSEMAGSTVRAFPACQGELAEGIGNVCISNNDSVET